jgi:3-isopropylmalate dehydrogenase
LAKTYKISYIEGDGIGPEIFSAAKSVLETLSEIFMIDFDLFPAPAGDKVLKASGVALPKDSFSVIRESDLCLKAPIGETALQTIIFLRQELDLFANIRPAKNYSFIESKFSNVDLVIVRENTEDLYVSKEHEELDGKRAVALKVVSEEASQKIARVAFETAVDRRSNRPLGENNQKLASVVCIQKSNVLPKTDGLFLRSCLNVSKEFPSVRFSSMYVDTAAMNLVRNPESFDVMVTSNMYGDILSDEASQVVGGLGLASSANLGNEFAIFEPVHGCAPDISGRGIANPLSMLFTVKMMLDWISSKKNDQKCAEASKVLETAVSVVTSSSIKTPDIGGKFKTEEVTRAICEEIRREKEKEGSSDIEMIREDVLLKW